jgi:regulation of enolase protein 1 (concanavalin A-like superfamily)
MERLTQPAGSSRWQVQASIEAAPKQTALSLIVDGGKPINWSQTVMAAPQAASWTLLVSRDGAAIVVTRHDNGYWLKYTLRDSGPATPAPSLLPSLAPTPTPEPTPVPEATYDCSNPPQPGTIAYATWSLHCKPIAP